MNRKLLTLSVLALFCLTNCKKSQRPDSEITPMEAKALETKYKLVPINSEGKSSNSKLSFNSKAEFESYLETKTKSFSKKETVKAIVSSSKLDGSFSYDGNSKTFKLSGVMDRISMSTGLPSQLKDRLLSFCGGEGTAGCHGGNMQFNTSWTSRNYYDGDDMHFVSRFKTTANGEITGMSLDIEPVSFNGEKFSHNDPMIGVNGMIINYVFRTTTVEILHLGIYEWSRTAVTDWAVEVDTCAGTVTWSAFTSS